MRKFLFGLCIALAIGSAAHAQTVLTWALGNGSPTQSVELYDQNGTLVSIGVVNSLTHTFIPNQPSVPVWPVNNDGWGPEPTWGLLQGSPFIYLSNVALNGLPVGNDSNTGLSRAAPVLTIGAACALLNANPGAEIIGNGNFAIASGDCKLTASAFMAGINGPNSFEITPAPGAAYIIEDDSAGGVITLQDLTLNAAGTSAIDDYIDANGMQSVREINVVRITGTNVPAISNAPNASANLTVIGGSVRGNGYGIEMPQMNGGAVVVSALDCALTPNSVVTGLDYDNGQGLCAGVDFDGTGASFNSGSASYTSNTSADVLPMDTSFVTIVQDFTIRNAGSSTVSNNTINVSCAAGDALTQADSIIVGGGTVNPITVGPITITGNRSTIACYGGGKAGPMVGFEGPPETAQVTFTQSGNVVTIASNITASQAAIAPSAAVVFSNNGGDNAGGLTNETVVSGSGLSWVGSVSQTVANTVAMIGGSPYIMSQAGTAITINADYNAANDTHAVTRGERIYGGPNSSVTPVTLGTPISIASNGVGTWNSTTDGSPSGQTVTTAALGYVLADRMTTSGGTVSGNNSTFSTITRGAIVEGGAAFCGFEEQISFIGNVGQGADTAGLGDKGCFESAWTSNVNIQSGGSSTGGVFYGSQGIDVEHNDFISPDTAAVICIRLGQPNDWQQTGMQYATGNVEGNLCDVPVVAPTLAVANGQAVTNVPGGTIMPETIVSGSGLVWTVSQSQAWAVASPVLINGVWYSTTQSGTTLTIAQQAGPQFLSSFNSCATLCLGAHGSTYNGGSSTTGIRLGFNDYWYAGGTTAPSGNMFVWDFSGSPYEQIATNNFPAWGVGAAFTGSISGTTLTATGITGTIAAGQLITTGATSGTYIVSGSGSTWTVSPSQTVSSAGMFSGGYGNFEAFINPALISLPTATHPSPALDFHPVAGSAICSGSSQSISGDVDYYGQVFAGSPTYGAAQCQNSNGGPLSTTGTRGDIVTSTGVGGGIQDSSLFNCTVTGCTLIVPFRINGSTGPEFLTGTALVQTQDGAATSWGISSSESQSVLNLARADGTFNAITALLSGEDIGQYNWYGANGQTSPAFVRGGIIDGVATANWSGSNNEMMVEIDTTLPGTTSNVVSEKIQAGACVGSGCTPQGAGTYSASAYYDGSTRVDIPIYSHAGAQDGVNHVVQDTATLSSGSASVTLTSPASYTSSGTYVCVANDATAANPVKIANTSGSAFVITGTSADVINYVCSGH
jgi:hypothetical protein